MSAKDLDKLHNERVDAVMASYASHDGLLVPEDLFLSERVAQTVASEKMLINSYRKETILATIPFTPVTYVAICPACIDQHNWGEFQKLVQSGLVIPILTAPYAAYPEMLAEFLIGADHVSGYEYQAYKFARLHEREPAGKYVCAHCVGERLKKILAPIKRKKGSGELRDDLASIAYWLQPFVFPDYTLLDQLSSACRDRDLHQLQELKRLAGTIHHVRNAQAFDAPITVDEDALAKIPVDICSEADEGLRLVGEMGRMVANGLGLAFPLDVPLDQYIELVRDYQPAISKLIEYTNAKDSASIDELSKRLMTLNAEIERIRGLKRYVVLEASMSLVRQNKDLAFTTVLAGALGLAGHGWLGCGSLAANGAVRAARKMTTKGVSHSKNEPAKRLAQMISRDLQPYLSSLIAAYVGSTPAAINVLFLRKRLERSKAA